MNRVLPCLLLALLVGCSGQSSHSVDLVLRGGVIYDGSGSTPVRGDIAINADTIVAVGDLGPVRGRTEIDVHGLAIAPGFINMLAHSEDTYLVDGRSQGDIRQGVTLEVFGEGSMGPLNDTLKAEAVEMQGDVKYPITWTTLGQYLDLLEQKGISANVASFVGAGTVRSNILHYSKRRPTPSELDSMKALVRQAMAEGAVGLSCALQYVPDVFMTTDELVAMAQEASRAGGIFAAHIRNEGDQLLEAVDEFLRIVSDAHIPGEIYHLKASGGKANWGKMDSVIARIDRARAAGVPVTADMYTYAASATGLDVAMPPWVQEGGYKAWAERLKDPAIRARVKKEMDTPTDTWDNAYVHNGPDKMLFLSFKNDKLKPFIGKTLAEVARMRGTSPEETAMDLVIEDGTRVGVAYFSMTEDNIRKQIQQPWMSFDSDEGSYTNEGVFLKSNPHPRAYGTFARLLGKYVRDEKLVTLGEAIRRLTSFPAATLKLRQRGLLKPGYFADVVVFDPASIRDHATFEKPHQYSTGVAHVFVNGVQVLKDGEHTGAKPGRIVRGAGWNKNRSQ